MKSGRTLPSSSSEARQRGAEVRTPLPAALLLVDVQESFRHRPYWTDQDEADFLDRVQGLVDGARRNGIFVAQVFHVEESGPFSLASGHVATMRGLGIDPDAIFHKRSHSALVGSGLETWLIQRGVRRVIVAGIRSEQCCETTTRHAADLGFQVDYVTEATLTFPMVDRQGTSWSPQQIKARCELVLEERFARIVNVRQALDIEGSTPAAGGPGPSRAR